jgi:hypothetical protein
MFVLGILFITSLMLRSAAYTAVFSRIVRRSAMTYDRSTVQRRPMNLQYGLQDVLNEVFLVDHMTLFRTRMTGTVPFPHIARTRTTMDVALKLSVGSHAMYTIESRLTRQVFFINDP